MTVVNRVAIVTGGAMGNGKGIAEVLASQGAKVAIFDKSDILPDTVEELTGKGYEVCGFKCPARAALYSGGPKRFLRVA